MRRPLTLTVLAFIGAWLAPGPAVLGDESQPGAAPPCTLCNWPLGWRGWFDLGPGWVSDSDPRFGDYGGLDEAGGWLSTQGEVRYLDDRGQHLDLGWREPALDARRLWLRGGRQGHWSAQLDWREIPHVTAIGARSPFMGVGGEELLLPPGWVRADTTSGMAALDAGLRPVEVALQRSQLDFRFDARLASRWRWEAEASRIRREGTRAFGAGSLTLNTSHVPAPVDHVTDRIGLAVEYLGEAGAFHARLGGSWFDNGAPSLAFDNPFTSFVGADRLRAALEPSNRAWKLQLGGSWRPTPRLRLSGRAGIGEARQDDAFLPYSTLPEFEDQTLPRTRLDGRVEALALHLAGQLQLDLDGGWDLSARARLDDRDNRTPVSAWMPVITDFYQREATFNRPYSFRRDELSVQARYRGTSGLRGVLGARRQSIERSLQSVAETTEDALWAELGTRPAETLGLTLRLEAAERDASDYTPLEDPGLPGNPLMRKFNLADRSRHQARLDLDWTASSAVSVNAGLRWSDDDYDRSPLGLQSSDEAGLELGLQWMLGEDRGVHGWIGAERVDAVIASQQDFSQPWRSRTEDDFLSWGFGGHAGFGERWTARLDVWGARSTGQIDTDGTPFPDLETDLRHLALWLEYDDGRPWAWKLALEHERYDSRDWQQLGLEPDSIPAVLTLGLQPPDGSVTVLRALGSYRF